MIGPPAPRAIDVGQPAMRRKRAAIKDKAHRPGRRLALRPHLARARYRSSISAQNVILGCLEFTAFRHHAGTADPITAEMLRGTVSDERRHMGFGENDLGRRWLAAPHTRDRLHKIKRELDSLVLDTFSETMGDLGMGGDHRPDLAGDYMAAVARLGFRS